MTAFRINTPPYPHTKQRVQLDGVTYGMRLLWSQRGTCWHIDLSDAEGNAILSGLRLVVQFPLLSKYRYLTALPPGELYMFDLRDQHGRPTLEEMGSRYRLYYVDAGGFT